MAIEASGRRDIPAPMDVVWAHLKRVAPGVGKVKKIDERLRRLTIATGASAFSWGEDMVVQVEDRGPGASCLSMSSAAAVPTNITASDKNKENLDRLSKAVEQSLRGTR